MNVFRAGVLAAAVTAAATLTAGAQTPSAQAGTTDEHPKLPPGDGRDLTIKVCGQCHDPDNVADQDLDTKGWKQLVDDMASKGADATDAQLDQIVAYLSKSFPPSK
ncbi:MAG TPA: cytochrome c [Vicinamibacterales bacterium]|jgi:mono/diheme cytochrome c family protein|nr:cytochrome c [Vicinamibacterales bacterium]